MTVLLDLIREFGLAFVFANVLVEQVGLPVPAYPTLIVAGASLALSPGSTAMVLGAAASSQH